MRTGRSLGLNQSLFLGFSGMTASFFLSLCPGDSNRADVGKGTRHIAFRSQSPLQQPPGRAHLLSLSHRTTGTKPR